MYVVCMFGINNSNKTTGFEISAKFSVDSFVIPGKQLHALHTYIHRYVCVCVNVYVCV